MTQSRPDSQVPIVSMGTLQDNRAAPYNFSIGDVVSESWKRVSGFKATIWGAIGYIVLVLVGFFILQSILMSITKNSPIAVGLVQIISGIVMLPLGVGLSFLGMRRSADLPIRAKMIFSMFPFLGRFIGLYILQLVILLLLVGLYLLPVVLQSSNATGFLMVIYNLIVGIAIVYFSFSFIFAYLLVAEKKLGVFSAYAASFCAFSQHWLKIIVTLFVMLVIYLISMIPLGIGLIWTIPMFIAMRGILYRIAFGVEDARTPLK